MATDFSMSSGDTKNISITITDSAGDAVDLTGATSIWAIYSGGTALLTKTSAAGAITYGGASTNVATVAVAAADTESIAGGVYRHELEITDTSGNVSTACSGTVVIVEDKIA